MGPSSLSRFAVLLVLMSLTGIRASTAQSVTGSIFGTVSDASGSRLPGVTVIVSSPQLITGQEVRTTSDQGLYRFPTLPPGAYTVTFELQGFQTLKREGIALLAGQSLAVDATLALSQIRETITVAGEAPLIDTRNAALMNTADSATLEHVPMPRNFTDILNTMPGVTDGLYDFSRVNNVHGGTTRQNVYNLDGINTDDPNTNAPVTDLAVDAFQEVQVSTAGIAAEFGDASGGVFNYITKSGGNEFRGGVNYYYQTKGLESDNVSAALKREGVARGGFEHVYDRGALIGGPIARNRAWFFANYRNFDQRERRSDFSGNITTTDHQLFAKGTVQVSAANRAELGFYFRDSYNFPLAFTVSFRNSDDPRTWFGVAKNNYIGMPRWTSTIGNNTVLEARGSMSLLRQIGRSDNNLGAPAYQDVATGIITGGDDQANANINDRKRHQFKADISRYQERWLGGNHTFKAGVDWQTGPIFEYRFLSGARGSNELQGCPNGNGCVSPTPDMHHLLFNGAPFRVRLWNTPRTIRFVTNWWAAYGQDQWVIRDRVTLNAGTRVEHVSGRAGESGGGGGRWEPEIVSFPERQLLELTTVAPRIGIVWDLTRGHSSALKTSYGRFYYQINNNHIFPMSLARAGFREFDWVDRNGDRIYQPGEEGILRADTRPNPARLPTVDPDLKNQHNDVFTIGFERRLPSNVAFAVTAIFKREGNLLGTVNAAVPFSSYNPLTVVNPITQEPMTIYTLRTEFRGRPGQTVLTNPGNRPDDTVTLARKYNGLEVVLRKRLENRWQFETSYVWGRGKGNVGNAFQDSNSADYSNPNSLINRYGDLPLGPRHQFKTQGVYLGPYGLVFSGYFQALSGIPWTDTISGSNTVKGAPTVRFFQRDYPQMQAETFIDVAGEPAGARKFDTQTRLDLRIEKRFGVGYGTLSLILDAFNILNAGTVVLVRDLRLDNPNFGVPAQVQVPRQLRLAAKWNF